MHQRMAVLGRIIAPLVNERVIRGGSWATPSADLRSAFRDSDQHKMFFQNDVGFRIARMPLAIASPQDTSIRLFLDTSPTTQVQVVLGASDAATLCYDDLAASQWW